MDISNLTAEQLRKAADLQEKILGLKHELAQLLGEEVSVPIEAPTVEAVQAPENGKRKRPITEAHRRALSRAAKARWAREKARKAGL
jgi:hypothetical protein